MNGRVEQAFFFFQMEILEFLEVAGRLFLFFLFVLFPPPPPGSRLVELGRYDKKGFPSIYLDKDMEVGR